MFTISGVIPGPFDQGGTTETIVAFDPNRQRRVSFS
jgi:hypothetical protein